MRKLKLGIVGCGKIASYHLHSMKKAGFKLHSISGTNNSKNALELKKKFNIYKLFDSSKLHIQSKDYDALLFLTPPEITYKYLLKIDNTKKVLTEKPVTFYSNKLKRLEKKKNIKIAFNRRQYKNIEIIKSKINENSIIFIEASIPEKINFLKENRQILTQKNYREKYYNIFYNSVHIFDLIKYLVGSYSVISIKHLKNKTNKLLGYVIHISSNKVQNITIRSIFNASENFSFIAYSANTKYELSPIESISIYKGMSVFEPNSKYPIRQYIPKVIKYKNEPILKNHKPGFINQAKSFYNFCNKKKTNLASIKDLVTSISLVEKIFKYLSYKKIKIDS